MKSVHLKGKIGRALLSLSLLLFIGVAFGQTTQAQWWGNDRDRNRRERAYERERRQQERERIREQRRQEREARRNGSYGNDGYYRNDGYRRNDGYYGNSGYGNYGYGNNELRQTALNAGFNNGREEGRKDRQRGERYEYRDESDYQKATEDYSSRLGDRGLYQQYFRQGFANGYRTGYNGY